MEKEKKFSKGTFSFWEENGCWFCSSEEQCKIALGANFDDYFWNGSMLSFWDNNNRFYQIEYKSVFRNDLVLEQIIAEKKNKNGFDVWQVVSPEVLSYTQADLLLVKHNEEEFVLKKLQKRGFFVRMDLVYPSIRRRTKKLFSKKNLCFKNDEIEQFSAPRGIKELFYDAWMFLKKKFS